MAHKKKILVLCIVLCVMCALFVTAQAADVECVHENATLSATLKAPNCNAAGVGKYVCDDCDATFYKAIPAAHTKPADGIVIVDPTCVKAGSETYTCTACGESIVNEIPATGKHTYDDGTIDATCTEPVKAGEICTVCGDVKGELTAIEGTELGHDKVENVTKAPTCTEAGEMTVTCSRCDYEATEEIPATGHKLDDGTLVEADCEKGQRVLYKCTNSGCDYSEEELTGIEGSEALGHTPEIIPAVDATCEATGLTEGSKCSVCDKVLTEQTETEKLPHSYDDGVVTAPTCSAKGYTTYTCTVCGDSYKDAETEIVADAHNKVIDKSLKSADCTTAGVAKYKCSICGTSLGYEAIPAGHIYDEGKVTTPATCTEAGVKTYTCTVCQATKTEEIAALGHTKTDEVVTAATCGKAGTKNVVCSVCLEILEENVTIEATGKHTFEEKVIDATCTESAMVGEVCSVCGTPKGDLVPVTGSEPLGHKPVDSITKAPTCTEDGTRNVVCSVCEEVLEENVTIEATGHTWDEGVYKDATCTEGDHMLYTCACGETMIDPIGVYPATGHTEEIIPGKAATCTETGLTEGKKCSVCGETLVAQETIPVIEHTYTSVVTAPTCKDKGYTTYTCACGDTYTADETPIKPDAHKKVIGKTLKPADCTTAGVAKMVCELCGEAMGYEAIPAGHSYDDGVVTTAPTCTEAGVKTFTCSVCNGTTTEEIAALGHTATDVILTAATCGKAGTKKVICSVCDTVLEENVEISATGEHDFKEGVTAATCTTNSCAGMICTVCGAADGELTEVSGTALGHDFAEAVTKDPTCTEKGEVTVSCTRCDYKETKEVDALDHIWDDGVYTDATCTEAGCMLYTCTLCGETSEESVGEADPATGHDYTVEVIDATCTEDSKVKYTCSKCGDTYTETTGFGDATGHTPEAIPAVDATCAATGLTEGKKCSVCGEILVQQEETAINPDKHTPVTVKVLKEATCTTAGVAKIACEDCKKALGYAAIPAGHTYDEGKVTTPATCVDGVMTYTCTACGETKTETIAAVEEHALEEKFIDATCTANARVQIVCSKCGLVDFDDEIEGTMLEHEYNEGSDVCVNECDHDYKEEITTPATCTTPGVKTFTCDACKDSYTEEIPAAAHTEEIIPGKAATCTETGLTEGKKCSVCGEILVKQEEIPAIDHDYEVKYVDGAYQYVCKNCGAVKPNEDAAAPASCNLFDRKGFLCAFVGKVK